MAAVSPRITFTPTAETFRALSRLALIQQRRPSLIVREMMDGVALHLDRLADMLEGMATARFRTDQAIVEAVEAANDEFLPHAAAAIDAFNALSEAVAGKPPSCNTGVTTPRQGCRNSSASADHGE